MCRIVGVRSDEDEVEDSEQSSIKYLMKKIFLCSVTLKGETIRVRINVCQCCMTSLKSRNRKKKKTSNNNNTNLIYISP
jgi:hypothetical protein